MRILIDESLPKRLAAEFEGLNVSTVRREGWNGLRNGVLLRAAVEAGFDVVITADRALRYQKNLEAIGISVLVLSRVRNRFREVRMLVPQIRSILPLLRPGDAYEIGPLRGDMICDRPIADQLLEADAVLDFT
jgi:hypothetical protein